MANEPGMSPLVAHCHLGLGTLHRRTSKWENAREHITPAETMFGEMDTPFWREQATSQLLTDLT